MYGLRRRAAMIDDDGRTPLALRVKLAGIFLLPTLAFPGAAVGLMICLQGTDQNGPYSWNGLMRVTQSFGHVLIAQGGGTSESMSAADSANALSLSALVFILAIAPLCWTTFASLFIALISGDCRLMVLSSVGWVVCGIVLGLLAGIWPVAAGGAVAFAMVWTGRSSFASNRWSFVGLPERTTATT
jgi:hypothetical protein